jgi:hypothetical protein
MLYNILDASLLDTHITSIAPKERLVKPEHTKKALRTNSRHAILRTSKVYTPFTKVKRTVSLISKTTDIAYSIS